MQEVGSIRLKNIFSILFLSLIFSGCGKNLSSVSDGALHVETLLQSELPLINRATFHQLTGESLKHLTAEIL